MLNKVQLIGRVGRSPEERFMPNGDPVCAMSIATTERWRDKASGDMQERTEWWRVVLYKQPAAFAVQYVQKGDLVYIEGSGRTKEWTDKTGAERKTFEVQGMVIRMLKNAGEKEHVTDEQRAAATAKRETPPTTQPPAQEREEAPKRSGSIMDMDDDIPFSNPYRGRYSYVV